jgi:hypothetical protein
LRWIELVKDVAPWLAACTVIRIACGFVTCPHHDYQHHYKRQQRSRSTSRPSGESPEPGVSHDQHEYH